MTEFMEIAAAILVFMFLKFAFSKQIKVPWRNMILEYISIVLLIWIIKSAIHFLKSF